MRWFIVFITFFLAQPSWSQSLIRDAEIEYSLDRIAAPLFEAAGLNFGGIQMFIVNDSSMNAFVLGNDIYIHAGLIQRLPRVEQLQAVIAHEIGHITGGHLSQRSARIGQANTAAGLGLALGIALAASGGGAAGAGLAAGLSDAAIKDLLSFTRAQEASADQTGALIMAAAGINPIAALEVMELFRGKEYLNAVSQDPYTRTHPLTAARLQFLEETAERYASLPRSGPAEAKYWYARARAKFDGFRSSPNTVLRRINASDQGEIATLRRAIAYFKLPDFGKSQAAMARLLELRPDDPFYHDLNGQILLESGRPQAAIAAYEKALSYRQFDGQILAGLGRAQLALETNSGNRAALESLERSYARDSRNARMLRDLSLAYARNGQDAMASLATAERFALSGRFRQASIHAKRAIDGLPSGSIGALKAEDIIAIAKRAG